jgi:hypothetical protein
MSPAERMFGSEMRGPWLSANFFAFTVGGALAGGVLRFMGQPYYGSSISAIDAGFVQAGSLGAAEAIFGLVLGTAQWLVLRRVLRSAWWIPATCVGFGVAGAIGGFMSGGSVSTIGPAQGPVPPILAVLVGHPLSFFVLLGPQWLILRRKVEVAVLWPIVHLFGILAGFGLGLAVVRSVVVSLGWLAPTDFPSWKSWVLIGAVGGLVYGVFTWSVLSDFRPRLSGSIERQASGA